ncbi:MAG TPA: tetratricopeptide repeat protein [Marmoricola sp.]|nr:tetratricopeptide repeat protein [Marmoricola sp.]
MIRTSLVLVVAATLSVSGAIGLTRDGSEGTAPPVAAPGFAQVVGGPDLESTIESLQVRLRKVPADAPGWATLAVAYVEQARVSGDASLYTRADAAVARSLEEQPQDNAPALAADAALAAARHDFSAALEVADRALAVDPYFPGALAIRVDALTELGRYDAQLDALRRADRRQPGFPIATRYAYAYELRGQLRRAAAVLRRAATTPVAADRTFALTLLADVERRQGRLDRAADHLREALRATPGSVPALASQARLAVARGDLDAAVRRWQRVVTLLPLPEYLTELGELHLVRGESREAEAQFDVVRATHELLAANGVDTDLESALFEADHGSVAAALASARAEWDRRHSIHVADVLAWALHRSGRDREAIRHARFATRLGTAEGRLWLHRGTIEAALGDDEGAVASLRRGLTADLGQSPWQADRARRLLHDLGGRP